MAHPIEETLAIKPVTTQTDFTRASGFWVSQGFWSAAPSGTSRGGLAAAGQRELATGLQIWRGPRLDTTITRPM